MTPSWLPNVLSYVLAAEFVTVGLVHLLWRERTRADSKRWGYSEQSIYVVAVFEIIVGAMLLNPATDLWAALALLALMFGALWTTMFHGKWYELFHPTLTLGALMVFIVLVR